MQTNTPCPVVYFEIGCTDIPGTENFYKNIFGWQTTNAGIAAFINTQSDKGIQGHITALGHEPHKYVTVYIQVSAIEEYIVSLEAGGGKKIVGPVKLPDGSRFAWFTDPAGNIMGLLEKPKQ